MKFGDQVETFVKKAVDITNKEFGRSVLALHNDIVVGTPVDEGILQNNWQFGINKTNGQKLPDKAGKNFAATVSRAAMTMKGLTIKDDAIIFNNMEYASAIENGIAGTRRVPARMVAKAILMAQARNSK